MSDKGKMAEQGEPGIPGMKRKMSAGTYICENPNCKKEFTAKKADRKRGWARCCGKSCAAWTREKKLDRNDYYSRRGKEAIANGGFSNEEHDCNKE